MMDSEVGYSTLREINCTIHWFKSWNDQQKELFLNDLVEKALPEKVQVYFT